MFCIKDLLYIFLQLGKYIVLFKRFIMYIYLYSQEKCYVLYNGFIYCCIFYYESFNYIWGIKIVYFIVNIYIILLDNYIVYI